jgi:hypothetical protein
MSSMKDLQAQVEELKKQLEVEKQKKTAKISFKVSPKGAVSVYGLQRFPVTLYKSQWRLLLEQHNEELLDFIADHEDELVDKEKAE